MLRDAQTSTVGSRTSRRRGSGARKSWEDARVPSRRVIRERVEKERMSPWVGGRSLRAQRYMKEGNVWAKMTVKVEGSSASYTFPS